jgi:hypothetical protein
MSIEHATIVPQVDAFTFNIVVQELPCIF